MALGKQEASLGQSSRLSEDGISREGEGRGGAKGGRRVQDLEGEALNV